MENVPLPKFRLSLLARFELTGPDGPVDLRNKKLAGLLAYLACTAPVPQPREKLATLLWGSHFDTQARQNLRQALFRIRRALGEDALISDGEEILLGPGVFVCDATRLEALIRQGSRASLAEAVDLYKQGLLVDVAITEEAWADWVTSERQRLEGLALDALVRLGEIELDLGDTDKALETAHRALAINALREDAHRLLVEGLSATGRKAEALKHYQDLVTLLKRELNTEPDAATKALVAELSSTQPPSRSSAVKTAKCALRQPDQPSIAVPPTPKMSRDAAKEVNAEESSAAGDAALPTVVAGSISPERRQLTIMACTMVGAMALSAGLDPEDIRDQIGSFHDAVADVVGRFGGFVAQYLSDGVVVYFGYPAAHEHDAEQAVRAGLAILDAVGALNASSGVPIRVRAGIATGLVVVGEQLGTGDTRQHIAVGEAPTMAAQLQAVAAPGEIVVAVSTRRLVGGMFDCHALAADKLKGLPQPMEAWQVRGETAGVSRFEARHAGKLSPLVGRQEEMDLLLRRWDQARLGEGRVVLLSGEPGIGKSRIAEALLTRLKGEPHWRLRYFCSPQHTDSALYPIIAQMERAAGLAHDDSPQARLDRLDALMTQTPTSNENMALFAEMLSLPNDGRYPALELTPQQRRQRTLQALTSQMQALVRQKPVLMIFEDAHWIDPTSLELLSQVIVQIPAFSVLVLVTFRPEFEAPWIGRPHVTALTINRLAAREAGAMIDRIVGNRVLPASIRKDIVERTDGIPLFVEEMTKAVLEAGSPDEAEHTASVVTAGVVPASLHASLMARLDRLGPAKGVAQIGAAIGREFSHTLLAAVVPKPEAELATALDRLIRAGLLFRQGMPPHASYLFKHALVQDAAYGTLLREPRRALHRRIAETLEREFAEIAENQPELLARHCTEAGLIEKAADLWGKAGQRSLLRSAFVEAAEQLKRALTQMASLPATPALRRTEIELQLALVNALFQVKGYAAPETRATAERARLLFEQAEARGEAPADPLLPFATLYHAWVRSFVAFNGDDMRELAARVISLAEKQGASAPLMIGHRIMGITRTFTGHASDALAHFDRSQGLYDPAEHRSLASRFGYHDATVSILCYRAFAHWLLGYPEAALGDVDDALKETREIDQAATLMFANAFASYTLILCGSYDAANALLEALVVMAEEKGAVFRKAEGTILKGSILTLTGKCPDAIQMIRLGINASRSTGASVWMPLYLSYLARAHAKLGHYDDAWRSIGEAMTTMEETKELWCEAEVLRLAGEIALASPRPDAAKVQASFERALEVARKQQARSLELRAAMSMARLLRDRGERNQARDLLAPVYGWFTEGHDTLDLKNAKALLDELAR